MLVGVLEGILINRFLKAPTSHVPEPQPPAAQRPDFTTVKYLEWFGPPGQLGAT